MSFVVIGYPGDRRVTLFADACRAAGIAEPRVIAWTEVLRGAFALPAGVPVRIDSPGEDPEADALLRGDVAPTRTGGGARWYAGFVAGLGRIADAARAANAPLLNDPDEIAVMFDKRLCHARLSAAGVPVPPALTGIDGYAALRARMTEADERRVFVKPAHGSSASGVIALEVAPPARAGTAGTEGRIKAVTSAVRRADGFHNSLRVQTYRTEEEVAELVDALAPDGLHVERWMPKAALDGRVLDLRVVVVGGVPTHAVVRTSTVPMTNLHLGGRRGDLDAVRAALGEDGWREAMDVCARAAACFPRSLMVGVDLLVGLGWRRFAIGEVNAFGDLLPNLPGLPDGPAAGVDAYTAQVRAVMSALSGSPCAT
ncbi:STM4014 family protein [Actinomadura oligospora]|uniref:STM4014 family protein n=1 Tax=Actinomadura oligospora TaxID=111804 RepID=UPI0004797260|nr:STM4014 family protein [Actinomadura oligospora]